MPGYTTNVGDFLVIMLTGDICPYITEITQSDPLQMKAMEYGPYACLKHGDFVIMEEETEQFQKDCREGTNVFLESEYKAGRRVISGLKKLGVTDNQIHEILP